MDKEKLEYFRNDVKFTGKHSRYIDALWEQNTIKNSYIRTLYELYGIAAILGLRTKTKKQVDNSEGVRNLQSAQLSAYRPVLKTIMVTVLLLDETSGLTKEERINRAFRGPTSQEELEADMELFNSYVRGGIEHLYNELVERPLSIDDEYTDIRVGNLIALLENNEICL
ncbi:MAG: hypothetical protein IJF03_04070 [Lachnospiraceae bacterium]|nr:hypothetical protein [Lachnospiraceae bacterium]